MSYIDRLEQELVRAGFREPRRVWPARAAVTLATTAAATALLFALFGGPPPAERTAEPPASGEVKATLSGTMTTRESDGSVDLRVGVVAQEPVAIEVEARQDGALRGRGENPFAVGEAYVDLPLEDLTAGPVAVSVRVKDTDGDVATYEEETLVPAPPPLAESFAVLRARDDLVSSTPIPGFPDPAVVGDDAEIHELHDGAHGSVWLAAGSDTVCVAYYGPADDTAVACWPNDEDLAAGRAGPQVGGFRDGILLALVPDGTAEVRISQFDVVSPGRPLRGNVIAGPIADGVREVSWTAPDGSRQTFEP